jgi:hypothetical protein
MRIRVSLVALAVAAAWLGVASVGEARNLRRTLAQPVEGRGGILEAALEPLGSVISSQIANQIPTLSTSAGFTYEYNPELEVYERSSKTFGPLFSERAVTIGQGKFNVNLSYTYIRFDSINGHDLDDITSRIEKAQFRQQDGTLVDGFAGIFESDLAPNYPGLASNQIFTRVNVDLDLEAQLVDFSFTYGVLDNLDVNIDVPLLRTFARSTVSELTLDPRFEELINPSLHGPDITAEHAAREDAIGIGDIRLRSKYLALDGPLRLAGLVDLILPTGSPGNFTGTGDSRLGSYVIVSGTVLDIFEPHMQAGLELNCNNIDISQAKYLAGVTAQLSSFAAMTVDFIGRSEFGPLGRIPSAARLPAVNNGVFTETAAPFHGRPIFVNINRNDILDLAVGGKVSLGPQLVFFATATIPLNDDGLRADVVPTAGFEATF